MASMMLFLYIAILSLSIFECSISYVGASSDNISSSQEKKMPDMDDHEISILKQSLLNSLGMNARPTNTENKSYIVPERMLEEYNALLDEAARLIDNPTQEFSDANEEDLEYFTRSRRNAQDYKKKAKKCKRHEMTISVENLGWDDWVLAPREFPINYCAGDCSFPLNEIQNATNHAIIQSLYGSMGVGGVPRACCTPTELAPLHLLYLDINQEPHLKSYKDMTVTSCGCL